MTKYDYFSGNLNPNDTISKQHTFHDHLDELDFLHYVITIYMPACTYYFSTSYNGYLLLTVDSFSSTHTRVEYFRWGLVFWSLGKAG